MRLEFAPRVCALECSICAQVAPEVALLEFAPGSARVALGVALLEVAPESSQVAPGVRPSDALWMLKA